MNNVQRFEARLTCDVVELRLDDDEAELYRARMRQTTAYAMARLGDATDEAVAAVKAAWREGRR